MCPDKFWVTFDNNKNSYMFIYICLSNLGYNNYTVPVSKLQITIIICMKYWYCHSCMDVFLVLFLTVCLWYTCEIDCCNFVHGAFFSEWHNDDFVVSMFSFVCNKHLIKMLYWSIKKIIALSNSSFCTSKHLQ